MGRRDRHNWPPPKWLKDPIADVAMFHDQEVEVYYGTMEVDEIRIWRENNRTLLDIEHLAQKMRIPKTKIQSLGDQEIIDYIIKQGLHHIPDLAKSIKNNGVRVPLTLTYKKELLDGNRRFLACKYLMKTESIMEPNFTIVPVRCLKPNASYELKLKIISEMNFLPDYKEEWPEEVRAKFIIKEFERFKKETGDEDKAYDQIKYFLEANRADVNRFREVLDMIKGYVSYVGKESDEAKEKAEIFAREKFHFFEEFYNKALSGKNPVQGGKLIEESKELLYRYVYNQQLTSTMNVRDFAAMVKNKDLREYLAKDKGSFEYARSMLDDMMRPKKLALRIRRFCEFIESLSREEKNQISSSLKKRLRKAIINLSK
jgi:hypothetical protein